MKRLKLSLASLTLLASACGDSTAVVDEDLKGFGSELPGFAVLSTDDTYTASSIGFLDAEGDSLDESWLHSGTISPKLVEALSADAVLVTEDRGDGTFTVLDRMGTDVVSRYDLATGEVLGQTRVRDGFAVNPYDVVFTDDDRAFVLRYAHNPNPEASELDRGSDLLELDPATGALVGLDAETGSFDSGRIDLSGFIVDVTLGEETLTAYPNPASAIAIGDHLIIALARFTANFETAAPGAFVVHDLASGTSELIELGNDLRDCEYVSRVPGHARRFAVRCIGLFGATEPDQGLLVYELDASDEVNEVAAWLARENASQPNVLGSALVLDGERFLGVALGLWGDASSPDVAYVVSFESGEMTEVFRSRAGADTSGTIGFDPESGLVLVPDSSAGVRRLSYEGGELTPIDTFTFGRAGLRVRAILKL